MRFGFVVPHGDARDFAGIAGATWWVESWWNIPAGPEGLDEVRRRVRAGPPAGSLR